MSTYTGFAILATPRFRYRCSAMLTLKIKKTAVTFGHVHTNVRQIWRIVDVEQCGHIAPIESLLYGGLQSTTPLLYVIQPKVFRACQIRANISVVVQKTIFSSFTVLFANFITPILLLQFQTFAVSPVNPAKPRWMTVLPDSRKCFRFRQMDHAVR